MPDLSPKPFSYMPIRVTLFDRVTIGDKHYRLSREYDGEIILESVEETPRYETFSELEFYEMHVRGDAKVAEGEYSPYRKKYSANPDITFRSHAPHKRARALFYAELIKAYERQAAALGGLPRTVADLGPHMDSLVVKALNITHTLMAEGKPLESLSVSVGHFNKMYKMYIEADRKVDVLISKDAGPKRRHQVDEEALAIWETYAEGYANPNRPTKKSSTKVFWPRSTKSTRTARQRGNISCRHHRTRCSEA
ncbi:hypothetical protein [Ensifer aridi]|uniref:hypothetical protein n=1 Tax=Ensifer aridi TaxID=1708715 RepID=UPI000A101EBA|nr:hypothetical protein [Ensifer aridi]